MIDRQPPIYLPQLGCVMIMLSMLFLFLLPFLLVDVMTSALARLHLSRPQAMISVLAIFLGGLINIPVYRITRSEDQRLDLLGVYGFWGSAPRLVRVRRETIIAINVGGCVVPCLLAGWQVIHMARGDGSGLVALAVVALVNIAACYRMAKPVQGVGIMIPGFVSPLVSVITTWLVLAPESPYRVCVAFVAGVLGPLVGADLLHLKDLTKIPTAMLSIGGAGTFDGIVLSGVLAALLA